IQRKNRNYLIAALFMAVILLALLVKRFIYLLSFWKSRKHIAHYRIVEEIGSGGVGIVYKAHSIKSKSDQVAIKVLREEYSRDETTRERFKSEGSIIDKLSHPNIVNIREKGIDRDRLYLVMELLDGETLQQRIQRESPMEMSAALSIMRQVAEALHFIHGKKYLSSGFEACQYHTGGRQGEGRHSQAIGFRSGPREVPYHHYHHRRVHGYHQLYVAGAVKWIAFFSARRYICNGSYFLRNAKRQECVSRHIGPGCNT
ncbi:MAG: protein kinase, partial [bacterium]|nr:protein kinase [bacterium]